MRKYVVNRPDEEAMHRILDNPGLEELIVRLAWQAGLSRDEISALTWDQVSFLDERLELPDRMIPLDTELRKALWDRYETSRDFSPQVAVSSRGKKPLAPESISRLARQALDREGQTAVRLMDLRHDWIIRQLADKDWPTVARISGVAISTLQARFSSYIEKKDPSPRPIPELDEFKLWRVLQAEKGTPAGLALWLAWQMGLQAQEIITLTWDQVDFLAEIIFLPDRELDMTTAVRRLLEDTRRRCPPDEQHVLLTERTRKPMDLPRLSRVTRAALIRGGLDDVTLRDLRKDENRDDENSRLLRAARQGPLSRGDAMALLNVSKSAAYARLKRLVEARKLVRIGGKYYLPSTVVPPLRHKDVIRRYLTQAGFAYRQDIVSLLKVRPRQCTQILGRMVAAGELVQEGQRYYLPGEKKEEAK